MALKITCPHCGHPVRLEEPYPLPGAEHACTCGRTLSITYPMGLIERLRAQGRRFSGGDEPGASQTLVFPAPPPRPVAEPADRTTAPDRTRVGPDDATAAARTRSVAAPVTDARPRVKVPPPPPVPKKEPPPKPKRRRRRWLLRGALGLGTLGFLVLVAAVVAAGSWAWYCSGDLPSVETLGRYKPPTVTVVYDHEGRLLGEIYDQRRYVVPLEQIPARVRQAFIAAEDAGFYSHGGVDYLGIVRAVVRNLAKGRKAQGASTITQQVARNFLLSNEKTLTRKTKEVLLAWRIEDTFDKDHVLYLYLNQIYLGSRAYGVEAAARVYFGKHVEELDLAEASLIAGLPPRPSDYSPHRHFDKAKARQRYVLDQMVDEGYATAAEADAAYARPLDIVERTNEFLEIAPWFSEYIRIHLVQTYGEDRVLNEGLVVDATCDLDLQRLAQQTVTERVTALDEKIGWRGTDEKLDDTQIAERLKTLAARDEPMLEGGRYKGVVVEVEKKHAIVDLGDGQALIPLAWTEWAYEPDTNRNAKYRKQDDLTRALSRGDVVTVEIVHKDFRTAEPLGAYEEAGAGPFAAATLYQAPELQGALLSYRLDDGAVLAMVGGVDFKETKFNRAVQAQRQVGSTFKPIVYATAIASKEFTTATIVQDAPIVYNTLKSQLWKPENYGEEYLGDITLRRALALSRNVVTIRVLDRIGLDPVYQMARKLGITSPMDIDLSMGLGSGSLTVEEIARAYSPFATVGRKVEPNFILRVKDRDGNVLEEYQKPTEWERVLDPGVASITNWLLQEVATAGTAAKAASLGLHVAGKTGTTNDFHDAWFVGYTADVLTAVWVGYDQPRSIGQSSTGGQAALPIWMDFMKIAVPKDQDRPIPMGGSLVWVPIDETTGRPMNGGRAHPFLAGTAPTGAVVEKGQKTTEDLLTTEF